MKIYSVEAELFLTDGRTDRHDRVDSLFRNSTTYESPCLTAKFVNWKLFVACADGKLHMLHNFIASVPDAKITMKILTLRGM
jgi:hypothetical protein